MILVSGEVFRKFNDKHEEASHRLVYFTPSLNKLEWKSPDGGKARHEILFEDIMQVASERSRNDNKLCILAKKEVVILEAKDTTIKDTFVAALDFFLKHPQLIGNQ